MYSIVTMGFKHIKDMSVPVPETPDQNQAELAIYAAELGGEAPMMDLHGMDKNQALQVIDSFLNHEFANGKRRDIKAIKIVHGRGEGKLREAIIKHLKTLKFVERFRNSEDLRQADAVIWVALAPNVK